MRAKTLEFSKRTVNNSLDSKREEGQGEKVKSIYNSVKTLENRMKIIEDQKEKQKEKEKEVQSPVKRSLSQHAKLRPLVDKAPKETKKVELRKNPSKDKVKPAAVA